MTLTYVLWFTEHMELNGEPIMLMKFRPFGYIHVLSFIVSDIILSDLLRVKKSWPKISSCPVNHDK